MFKYVFCLKGNYIMSNNFEKIINNNPNNNIIQNNQINQNNFHNLKNTFNDNNYGNYFNNNNNNIINNNYPNNFNNNYPINNNYKNINNSNNDNYNIEYNNYLNNNQINNKQKNINNYSNINNNNILSNNYNNNWYQNNILNNQNNTSNNYNIKNNYMINIKYYFPLKGLCHIDSTYYMNSIIQCLLHSNELFAYFLNEYPNDCMNLKKKNMHIESQGNLSREFYNIVKGVQQDNNNNIPNSLNGPTNFFSYNNRHNFFNNSKAFSSGQLKSVLGYYNSQFRKFEANDSKDLILYLLKTMHEELNYFGENYSLPYKGSPNQFNEQNTFLYFMTSYNMRNFSIISQIYYGTYENIIQCQKCKKNIYIFQKFEFISFEMVDYHRKVFNIYRGFEDNEKPQLLKGDNKLYCKYCNYLCEAILTCKILQPPNKLLINIDYGKSKKIKPSKIEFDEEIDITRFINFNFNTNVRYRIICVCTHLEQSGNYGHYIAYCRHRLTGQWYEFNDSSCNGCYANAIYTGSPYLLLYERI